MTSFQSFFQKQGSLFDTSDYKKKLKIKTTRRRWRWYGRKVKQQKCCNTLITRKMPSQVVFIERLVGGKGVSYLFSKIKKKKNLIRVKNSRNQRILKQYFKVLQNSFKEITLRIKKKDKYFKSSTNFLNPNKKKKIRVSGTGLVVGDPIFISNELNAPILNEEFVRIKRFFKKSHKNKIQKNLKKY